MASDWQSGNKHPGRGVTPGFTWAHEAQQWAFALDLHDFLFLSRSSCPYEEFGADQMIWFGSKSKTKDYVNDFNSFPTGKDVTSQWCSEFITEVNSPEINWKNVLHTAIESGQPERQRVLWALHPPVSWHQRQLGPLDWCFTPAHGHSPMTQRKQAWNLLEATVCSLLSHSGLLRNIWAPRAPQTCSCLRSTEICGSQLNVLWWFVCSAFILEVRFKCGVERTWTLEAYHWLIWKSRG